MGEGKRRLSVLIREQQPACTYCGGLAASEEMDHCPPTALFDRNDRPRGLEFGACHSCHTGTRAMDNIAAMLSRIYPNPENDAGRLEMRRYIRSFINNHPDLAPVFLGDQDDKRLLEGNLVHVIDVSTLDRLHVAMNGFAARFGLAIYRHRTRSVATPGAAIIARWYSNHELFQGNFPEEVIREMGSPTSLQQGRKSVHGQFRYWSGVAADNPNYFGTFAVFRESFGIFCGIVVGDEGRGRSEATHRPGFLNGFSV